jgi:hypothetical protein
MGHTRLKKKKKGWATQKVQRGGSFNPATPTKQEQQDIDSFHDFWPLERGLFKIPLHKDPTTQVIKNWHLMRSIIRWLLINYSVPALGLTLVPSLLTSAPTYNFNFNPYTTSSTGHLFFDSSLSPSGIEPKGRKYIKIPEAVIYDRTNSFKGLCEALFPATPLLNQSTMYIVCDSGPGEFRHRGEASIATAIAAAIKKNKKLNKDVITARISITGAIAGLAHAIALNSITPAQIIAAMVLYANRSLKILYPSKSSSVKSSKTSVSEADRPYWYNVIGSICIAPLIIAAATNAPAATAATAAVAAATAAAAAATAAATATSVTSKNTAVDAAVAAAAITINAILPKVTFDILIARTKAVAGVIYGDITSKAPTYDESNKLMRSAYTSANMLEIILSATQAIAAAILVGAANTDKVSQIIAAANAASTHNDVAGPIGPFVKEIATPQRSADSATANPKPSTIPGDVYPIIYEFVDEEAQLNPATGAPYKFPDPVPPIANTNDLFYSDANLYTRKRYEIRYERHKWSPATGLGFKFVIGRIQAPTPAGAPAAPAAPAAAQQYEVEFGMGLVHGKKDT